MKKTLAYLPQLKTDEENDYFNLLNPVYVEARYDPDYKITKKQLEYLAAGVRKLQKLTKTICKEKIESFNKKD